jgi:tetratricopeptide (TPR) repeat protein
MTGRSDDALEAGRKRVYTFYSFKGGVGRSMTLANVAALLAAWDQRVLVVDWDLEAPGLERYFEGAIDLSEVSRRPGIVDLAEAAAGDTELDWRECLVEARPFADRPPVSLITAGRDDDRFLPRLQELDWERLFVEHDFGNRLERLREQWLEEFDYVLVDSRTGYTDIGGICTIYLPDVLVTMFTTSWQSLRGVLSVVRRARDARDRLPFDRGYLYAVPVPGRDESRVEYEVAQEWRRVYATELAELYRDFLPKGTGAADALELLRIPYVPFWSFGERLPVVQEGTRDPSSISYYFAVLARLLASGLRWEQAVGGAGVEVTVEPTSAALVGRQPRPEPLNQLPAASTDFTGRERELAQLRELVTARAGTPAAVGIVAVDGPAGVGKSALAIQVAHEVADRFPDAQLYLNLRGAEDEQVEPADALAHVLRTLGVPAQEIPAGTEERAARYRSELAGRQALVLLDNAIDEAHVRPLLPGSPGCLVLITSRRLLASLEGARQLSLDLMQTEEAVRLLAALAGRERVAAEPAAAEEVVVLCGHLPLAIRIAGARLRARPSLPVSGLAGRLADERRRLNELTVGDLGVRASFLLSYRQLAPGEARIFRRLGLLNAPDFGAGVVAALGGSDRTDPDAAESELAAEAVLDVLVDAQLVEIRSEGHAGQVRYYLNELLRTFAREMTVRDETPEAATAALRRALDWYLDGTRQAAERLGQRGSTAGDGDDPAGAQAALEWLEAERPSLVAAARQAAERGWYERAWELAGALVDFFDLRKHWDDWRVTSELGLAAARAAGNRAVEAGMLQNLGAVHQQTRRFVEATEAFEQSLLAFRQLDDLRGEASALRSLGQVARDRYELQRARELFDQSLHTAEAAGDRHLQAKILRDLGTVHCELGQLVPANDLAERSMRLFQELGDAYGEARVLRNLGLVHRGLGATERAIASFQQGLRVSRRLDDEYGAARTLTNLGIVHAEAGQLDAAVNAHEQALTEYVRVGDRHSTAVAQNDLGIVHAEAGRPAAAAEALVRALDLLRQLGDDHGAAVALGNLALVRVGLGERERAVEAAQESLDLLDRLDDGYGRVRGLWNLAAVVASARGEEAAEPLRAAAQVAFEQLDADRASELRPLLKVTDPAATALRWWAITR